MIFFNAHISRTGGLTLADILRRNFGEGHLDIYTQEIKDVLGLDRVKPTIGMLTPDELNLILDQHKGIKSISSHWIPVPSGIEILKERFGKIKLITFLRNPVDVIISKFFHFRRKYIHSDKLPEHMIYDYRNDLSLFVKHWDHVSQRYQVYDQCKNYITYVLDNALNKERALFRLKKEFWFIGLTERFNEGLVKLKDQFQQLGFPFSIYYHRRNKGPKELEQRKKLITKEAIKKIRNQNILDIELFEDAVQLYEENFRQSPRDINKQLLRFNQKLAVWQAYHKLVPNLKNRFLANLK
ncbi:uncharacterized protein METZ01_LOCUS215162 [marine metagenome]|uniref:Sulfotransferase domain-containing protein n=1 Tax=marine metagenome TaxID=408172 RepID=A0A382FGU5_9ZZZZ